MPVEPGPCRWRLPNPADAPAGVEALGIGGDLSPATLLAGYRTGLFPMPHGRRLVWWSPDPRGVLPAGRFHASRSLRRSSLHFEVSVDEAFGELVAACADPNRPGAWITSRYQDSYQALFDLGWAHSVEVWRGGRLAGGVFGVELGGLFCGEAMVSLATDGSKAALRVLTGILGSGADAGRRVFDVQWATPHLLRLGVLEVPRTDYLAALPAALALPGRLRPVARRPLPEVLVTADG
jgi:leucyl/phenylalanyl-tRNA--protein transferase